MRMGQGVRTGSGHGGITCVLQTQFSRFYLYNLGARLLLACGVAILSDYGKRQGQQMHFIWLHFQIPFKLSPQNPLVIQLDISE